MTEIIRHDAFKPPSPPQSSLANSLVAPCDTALKAPPPQDTERNAERILGDVIGDRTPYVHLTRPVVALLKDHGAAQHPVAIDNPEHIRWRIDPFDAVRLGQPGNDRFSVAANQLH